MANQRSIFCMRWKCHISSERSREAYGGNEVEMSCATSTKPTVKKQALHRMHGISVLDVSIAIGITSCGIAIFFPGRGAAPFARFAFGAFATASTTASTTLDQQPHSAMKSVFATFPFPQPIYSLKYQALPASNKEASSLFTAKWTQTLKYHTFSFGSTVKKNSCGP